MRLVEYLADSFGGPQGCGLDSCVLFHVTSDTLKRPRLCFFIGPVVVIDDIRFDADQSLQLQLYRQLADRILAQRYPPGYRLPSSRQMAEDLGVSRNTVNAVYDQLKAEGFLANVTGSNFTL